MKVFHHNDDDGRCAAAIVKRELVNVFEPLTDDDFIEYSYTGELDVPEFKQNETVYIVDLSLDETIFNKVIKPALDVNAKITHIDHHKTTFEYLESLTDDQKTIIDKVTTFYVNGLSGTMLTWVYSLMNDTERRDPTNVNFDFTDGNTHVGFDVGTDKMREYHIPDVIRYIDDNDVWRHEIENTKYFSIGFQSVSDEDKAPVSSIWDDLIYSSNQREASRFVNEGKIIWAYQEVQYKNNLKNSFVTYIFGEKCLCLNTCQGNSRIFCEKFDEYPMVCKFGYDGSIGKWRYTFYSSDKIDNAVDVSVIAKRYGGGGHRGAAAFISKEFLFK